MWTHHHLNHHPGRYWWDSDCVWLTMSPTHQHQNWSSLKLLRSIDPWIVVSIGSSMSHSWNQIWGTRFGWQSRHHQDDLLNPRETKAVESLESRDADRAVRWACRAPVYNDLGRDEQPDSTEGQGRSFPAGVCPQYHLLEGACGIPNHSLLHVLPNLKLQKLRRLCSSGSHTPRRQSLPYANPRRTGCSKAFQSLKIQQRIQTSSAIADDLNLNESNRIYHILQSFTSIEIQSVEISKYQPLIIRWPYGPLAHHGHGPRTPWHTCLAMCTYNKYYTLLYI